MKRDAVLFYESFDEAISLLPDEDQLKAYRSIIRYGLYGEVPQLYGEDADVKGAAGAIFLLAKPQIDANNRRYENGKKGGRPAKTDEEVNKKQSVIKEEPKEKREETQKEREKEREREREREREEKTKKLEVEDIFETVWEEYPEKKGKGKVSDKDKRKIAEIGVDKMLLAIQRYKEDVKSTNWKHWQNGSTFFHSGYIDYLDENYEKSKQARTPNGFNNAPVRDCDMKELEIKLLQSN